MKDTLKLVLKSADQKEKASLISREFFEWMVSNVQSYLLPPYS